MQVHQHIPHMPDVLPALDDSRSAAFLLKRAMDLSLAAFILLCTWPLLLIIFCIIRKDGGPALYHHPRVGRGGRMFNCIKFRSMVPNSHAVLLKHLQNDPAAAREWARDHKLRHDPRVTKIGALLRKTSLDELPQLINVLRGEMSLVGPRPVGTDELPRYGRAAAHYKTVLPGMTGLWQVSGRSDVSYDMRVKMDCWYVAHWSLRHDVAILLQTIPVLVKRRGAY